MSADYLIPRSALRPRARRIVSEDFIHPIAPLSASIHPLTQSENRGVCLVVGRPDGEQEHGAPPQPIVLRLPPDDRKPIENGTTRVLSSERRFTSQYQPPLPARRIVPQASVPRKRSSGSRSCCETLNAAEIRSRAPPPRLRQTSMKLPSPRAKPDRKLPSGAGMTPMDDLSC